LSLRFQNNFFIFKKIIYNIFLKKLFIILTNQNNKKLKKQQFKTKKNQNPLKVQFNQGKITT
jgi:hypothetical protein